MNTKKHSFLRKVSSAALAAVMIFSTAAITTQFTAGTAPLQVCAAESVKINKTKVELYSLDSWASEFISLPSDYSETFQLQVTGASNVRYYTSSSNITVSESGLIEPKFRYTYWYGNIGYSYPIEGKEPTSIDKNISYGKSIVKVYADDSVFDVEVNVNNYANYYANKVMDDYIAQNIKSTMSTQEKLEVIAKFVADRNYSPKYQSYEGLIIAGGGDCWASTNTVNAMAKKAGLTAWIRNGNRDPGAGSGHRNSMVYDGKDYYEVEAGYAGNAPRYYNVTKRNSLFSVKYNYTYGGYEVYQYDGLTTPETLQVPSAINGNTIVSIGEYFLCRDYDVKKVVLPSTIKNISRMSFNSCNNLESINIPSSLENISPLSFTCCYALKDVTASGKFSYKDGVIYKDNKVLVAAPNTSEVNIPYGIEEIADYAFYYNNNIKSIVLPETVKAIGEGAFGDCPLLTNLEIKGMGLKKISDFSFADSGLKYVAIPESVTDIAEHIDYYLSDFTVIGAKGSSAEKFATDYNKTFVDAYGSQAMSVTLDKKSTSITVGEIKRLNASMVPSTVSDTIIWKTSNSKVATVSNGVVTAKSAGKAAITAKTASGLKATCIVTVKESPFTNKSSVSSAKINLGESIKVTSASAGGNGTYQYAVFYKKANTSTWTCVQKYSSKTTVNITPKSASAYDIRVKAKDSGGNVANKDFAVTVTKPLTNTSKISVKELKLGESVITTNSAAGGEGAYQYAVFYKQKNQSKWTCVQSYKNKMYTIITPKAATTYNVRIKVKDCTGNVINKNFTLNVTK